MCKKIDMIIQIDSELIVTVKDNTASSAKKHRMPHKKVDL